MLEAVFLVLVIACGQFQLVAERSGRKTEVDHSLKSGGLIAAIIVAYPQGIGAAGITLSPCKVGQLQCIVGRIGQNIADRRPASVGSVAHIVQLVPRASRIIAISDECQMQVIGRIEAIAQLIGLVLGIHAVTLAGVVAPVWSVAEIVQRQAKIGFRARFIIGLKLELEFVATISAAQAQLGDDVSDFMARVTAAVDPLEPARVIVESFDQAADLQPAAQRGPSASPAMSATRLVSSRECFNESGRCFRYGGGAEVDCTTDCHRAVLDRSRTLGNFDPRHARDAGEVICRRGGVGCRRNQDAVFHQRHARGTVSSRPANPDIGTQAKAILFLQVDTGDLAQHPDRVAISEFGKVFGVQYLHGATDRARVLLARRYHDCFVDPGRAGVFGRFSQGGQRGCQQGDQQGTGCCRCAQVNLHHISSNRVANANKN